MCKLKSFVREEDFSPGLNKSRNKMVVFIFTNNMDSILEVTQVNQVPCEYC